MRIWESVYFARRASDGAIKIGCSGNVRARMLTHRNEHGRVTLLGCVRGSIPFEHEIHRYLDEFRLAPLGTKGCEWFRPDPLVLAAVDLILLSDGESDDGYEWRKRRYARESERRRAASKAKREAKRLARIARDSEPSAEQR